MNREELIKSFDNKLLIVVIGLLVTAIFTLFFYYVKVNSYGVCVLDYYNSLTGIEQYNQYFPIWFNFTIYVVSIFSVMVLSSLRLMCEALEGLGD